MNRENSIFLWVIYAMFFSDGAKRNAGLVCVAQFSYRRRSSEDGGETYNQPSDRKYQQIVKPQGHRYRPHDCRDKQPQEAGGICLAIQRKKIILSALLTRKIVYIGLKRSGIQCCCQAPDHEPHKKSPKMREQ